MLFVSNVENQLRLIRENHHLFEESKSFDLENVFKSKNMREFDENFTCPQFGFSKLEDYYSYPLKKNIQEITVPVLALNSIDDPISPLENLPFSSAKMVRSHLDGDQPLNIHNPPGLKDITLHV